MKSKTPEPMLPGMNAEADKKAEAEREILNEIIAEKVKTSSSKAATYLRELKGKEKTI